MRSADVHKSFLVGIAVMAWSGVAQALNCTPGGGIAYVCDYICPSATCSPSGTHDECDNAGQDDGKCTICGDGTAETITGTSGADVICANGGADTINSGGGGDIVDGGTGNDVITGGAGDDALFGGAGNDGLAGQGGRDFLSGGAGDDVAQTSSNNPDDDLGTLLCGGNGNDLLWAQGPGHQCMDAGADQDPGVEETDCIYSYAAQGTQGSNDVGTARNCVAPTSSGSGFITTRQPPCGCDD